VELDADVDAPVAVEMVDPLNVVNADEMEVETKRALNSYIDFFEE